MKGIGLKRMKRWAWVYRAMLEDLPKRFTQSDVLAELPHLTGRVVRRILRHGGVAMQVGYVRRDRGIEALWSLTRAS